MDVGDRRRTLTQAVTSAITQRTQRDLQRGLGPSEIGDPCDLCVARALTRKYPGLWPGGPPGNDGHFSLKAWVGTAVHHSLEESLSLPGAAKETTVLITSLDDYGDIHGHADLTWNGIVADYKTSDRAKIQQIRLNGPPWRYVAQINLYAYGLTQHHEQHIQDTCLFFIPRDSNKLRDVFPLFMPYRPDYAALALARLRNIWARVRDGHGPDMKSHPDCYECRLREWSA